MEIELVTNVRKVIVRIATSADDIDPADERSQLADVSPGAKGFYGACGADQRF
jgi:hypothetical protein